MEQCDSCGRYFNSEELSKVNGEYICDGCYDEIRDDFDE